MRNHRLPHTVSRRTERLWVAAIYTWIHTLERAFLRISLQYESFHTTPGSSICLDLAGDK